MVQDKTITTHKCELCGRWYDDRWQAEQCEEGCRDDEPRWTTDPPSEPGYYWIDMLGVIEIAEVQLPYFGKGPPRFYCMHDEDGDGWGMHKADKWWSEKIVPPQKEENNV